MKKDKLIEISKEIETHYQMKVEDIPSLDLYMDQILTLFDEKLKDTKRYDDDKILTKTMINNYSKAGVISSVKGKKYTKEQIIQMMIVYALKNQLSISEIKQVTSPIYEKEISLEKIYNDFLDIENKNENILTSIIEKYISINNLNLNNDENRLTTLLVLSSLSTQINEVMEKIVDDFYKEEK
ncbi:MAG: DUF1836 domain-containing protein [Thomasclavelia sp.]|nr:DUF1836 domain-containing protein [Thomasclavelia sp.]